MGKARNHPVTKGHRHTHTRMHGSDTAHTHTHTMSPSPSNWLTEAIPTNRHMATLFSRRSASWSIVPFTPHQSACVSCVRLGWSPRHKWCPFPGQQQSCHPVRSIDRNVFDRSSSVVSFRSTIFGEYSCTPYSPLQTEEILCARIPKT